MYLQVAVEVRDGAGTLHPTVTTAYRSMAARRAWNQWI